MSAVLLYGGATIIFLWGVGHLVPTRNIVSGFGAIDADNSRIITMEWLAEGLTLCFLGVVVSMFALVSGPQSPATHLLARASAGMLIALAILSLFTGARTSILPMKLCPLIKTVVATLFVLATLV